MLPLEKKSLSKTAASSEPSISERAVPIERNSRQPSFLALSLSTEALATRERVVALFERFRIAFHSSALGNSIGIHLFLQTREPDNFFLDLFVCYPSAKKILSAACLVATVVSSLLPSSTCLQRPCILSPFGLYSMFLLGLRLGLIDSLAKRIFVEKKEDRISKKDFVFCYVALSVGEILGWLGQTTLLVRSSSFVSVGLQIALFVSFSALFLRKRAFLVEQAAPLMIGSLGKKISCWEKGKAIEALASLSVERRSELLHNLVFFHRYSKEEDGLNRAVLLEVVGAMKEGAKCDAFVEKLGQDLDFLSREQRFYFLCSSIKRSR